MVVDVIVGVVEVEVEGSCSFLLVEAAAAVAC